MIKSKITVEQLKTWGLDKLPFFAVVVDLILVAVYYSLVISYLPTQNGDNIEHFHSSFMVAMGQVPYRDFFQHHNPLLWYLFAPVAKIFQYNTTVSEVLCFVSLLVFLKSLVYVYRIVAEFLADKFWGLMAAAMVAAPEYKLFAIDFRPDNYMIFCLMGGMYYLFLHLRDKKQWQLSVSFVWFFISFLFAQKALFPLFCLGVVVLYFLCQKEINLKVFGHALILPLIGVCAFLFYLYHYDMLELYYLSNYTFNLNLVNGFELHRIAEYSKLILIWVCFGLVGAGVSLTTQNQYWRIVALLFIAEFVQRRVYFSPYVYYYWLLVYFAVLCGVPLLYRLDAKNRVIRFMVLGVIYGFLAYSCSYYLGRLEQMRKMPYLPDYITRHINPCDYVFNGDGYMYNIFGKDPAYYWQLIGQLDVIGEATGIAPRPNVEELIIRLKPKFVYGASYFNKFSKENGRLEVVHYINPEVISKYYDYAGFGKVYQLKPEYDNRRCGLNADGKTWSYQN